ncbi:MAG: ribonuclease HII [Ruminococcus sp.]
MTLSEFDNNEIRKDHNVVCGCDEAGRGPLAGDVFAAAVIFDKDTVIEGINDSKKLTAKKREGAFFEEISDKKRADFSIQDRNKVERDRGYNIYLNAAMLAMKERCKSGYG